MRLSSVFLPATALLAQAASGFFLSSPQNVVTPGKYASMRFPRIGFYNDSDPTDLEFEVDVNGKLVGQQEQASFVDQGPGFWCFQQGTPEFYQEHEGPPAFDQPFAIEDGKLLYKGEIDLVWFLCGNSSGVDILLAHPGREDEGCISDVTIEAVELEQGV
ncbi:hypothetical protein F5144DRAFT_610070 [Chaetomium tenue]|uniref:Uncharacterized protein n=1 Tax=Chaetomium tenue TaxID=1854479 RepID=A0ACB7PJN9_9PEZI|nr:hypothetical protein F5144DRAFT_610070 [Chaetomium globosum]